MSLWELTFSGPEAQARFDVVALGDVEVDGDKHECAVVLRGKSPADVRSLVAALNAKVPTTFYWPVATSDVEVER